MKNEWSLSSGFVRKSLDFLIAVCVGASLVSFFLQENVTNERIGDLGLGIGIGLSIGSLIYSLIRYVLLGKNQDERRSSESS